MLRAILPILGIAISAPAAAVWILASESGAAAAVVYVDPVTILRTGNKATLMELTDYKIVSDQARDEPAKWLLFVPGTVSQLLWNIACRANSKPLK